MNCVRFAHHPGAYLCSNTRHLTFPSIFRGSIRRLVGRNCASSLASHGQQPASSMQCGCVASRQTSASLGRSQHPGLCIQSRRQTSRFARAASSTANGAALTAQRPAFMPHERIRQLKVICSDRNILFSI